LLSLAALDRFVHMSLALATISFTLCFAAWGLIGGLATVFAGLYGLNASQTAFLVAVPVLLGKIEKT
jgi:nitrate/nitrite transporter NarK